MRWLKAMALIGAMLMAAGDSRGQEAATHYQVLVNAEILAFGGVGFAARISDTEVAFQKIMAEDHAVETFSKLLAEAKRGGQVYALIGLYAKDRRAFARQVKLFKAGLAKDEKIMIWTGCTILPEDARDVIKRIESGSYGLRQEPGASNK